jgi:PAS domain S-box-containing protein
MTEDREMHAAEPEHILVVADASVNLEILTHLLTEEGYSVHCASDGELALTFVQSNPPGLILLSTRLPGMDGYEVCRRLKADEQTASIPVVFIGILEDEGEKVNGFQAGGVDYIAKPFQAAEVLARVGTHLRLQKLTDRLNQTVRERAEALAITERKKAQAELLRLTRQLRVVGACNRVVMRASEEQSLLGEVCRILCEMADYPLAWVGYPRDGRAGGVHPVAWAGEEAGDPTKSGLFQGETENGQDSAGRAILERVSVCIPDLAAQPLGDSWQKSALERGYRAFAALPLREESAAAPPYGVLCIYASAPDAFSSEEIHFLEELAGRLAFGIKTLRMRAEHEKAAAQLFASKQLFRALVESSPDFIARYDLDLRRSYVNPAARELFGGPAQDLLGGRPGDPSPISAPPEYMEHLRQAIETAAECDAEIAFLTSEGEMRWSHVRFVPELGPDGQVASVFSIGRDIHEIKENEQRFRTLAANFPDTVIRFDRDCRITYVNPTLEKSFNLPAEAIVGKTLHQLPLRSEPEQNDALIALVQRVFTEGEPNHSEARWDTPFGQRVFEVRHVPEKDAAGNVVGVLGTSHDITERRRMEQERAATLQFFECLDRVNRAIQSSSDPEQMMSEVLDVVLSVFDCDRVFLLYPCEPQEPTWRIPMESTRPEYPGLLARGRSFPADPRLAEHLRMLLAADGPVQFGSGAEFQLPDSIVDEFAVENSICVALHPRQGQAWLFGLHRCAVARVWTREEEKLFQEIGRRIEDALTSMLVHRNLRESEERYRLVFENSPVSIWEEDFSSVKVLFDDLKNQGLGDIEAYFDRHPEAVRRCAESVEIVDVNPAALALHGAVSKEELLTGLVQIFTPDSFDTFRRQLVCLWHGRTRMMADAVVKTLAEERRQVSVLYSVCAGYEETLSRVIVSRIDITERKRNDAINIARLHLIQFAETHSLDELLEATLNEAEKLTDSRIGFYHFVETDQEALILQNWSTATKRDYCTAEAKGLHYPIAQAGVWVDCVHQRNAVIHNDYASLPHRKGMPEGHAELIRELVVPVFRGESIRAILGVGNKPTDYVESDVEATSMLADLAWEIAERKRTEEELDKHREHLEELVQERTAELAATNQELRGFSYSVSHDLRAPLRHIDGFLELLREEMGTVLDEQGQQYMEAISGASARMGRLIDGLLSYSGMGHHTLAVQKVELGALVRDAIEELAPDTAGRSIDWHIGDLPEVLGDTTLLRIVLVNLIANAVKFTRSREEARIEIGSLFGKEGQEKENVVYVRDNGVGFDMAFVDKLFGVFQRLHRAEEFEGTGIGLANVRRIIDRHGGRAWAEGALDQGAAFYFSLPKAL